MADLKEYLKPTYPQVNEPHMILGLFDWRYAFAAVIPALMVAAIARSKLVFVIALAFFEWVAWCIYSKDPKLPLVWIYTLTDKSHICPFSKE
jgi:hypothetical protein